MFLEVYSGPPINAFPMALTDTLEQEALVERAKYLTSVPVNGNGNGNISDNCNNK